MIKVGIIGATGYAGNEIVRLLLGHKDVKIVWFGSRSYIDQKYADVYRNMFKLVDARCMDDNMEQLADEVDVIFTATPQGLCASLVNDEILSKVKIIDLSADFRLKNVDIYEKWYKLEHKSPQYIDEAVYGLCEINRDKVNNTTRIIANPGCYTTTSILTLYPLVKEGIINPDTIIIDAKSGTSGAGRGAKVANLFCEVNESMKAYGVGTHRHTPEIEEQLGYACGRDDLKLILFRILYDVAPILRTVDFRRSGRIQKSDLFLYFPKSNYRCSADSPAARYVWNGNQRRIRRRTNFQLYRRNCLLWNDAFYHLAEIDETAKTGGSLKYIAQACK